MMHHKAPCVSASFPDSPATREASVSVHVINQSIYTSGGNLKLNFFSLVGWLGFFN